MTTLDPGTAPAGALVALVVTRTGRLLPRCGGLERWRPTSDYALLMQENVYDPLRAGNYRW